MPAFEGDLSATDKPDSSQILPFLFIIVGLTFSFHPENQSWMELIPASDFRPSPRRGHSASVVGNSMYIFGGRGGNGQDGPLDGLFKFDLGILYSMELPRPGVTEGNKRLFPTFHINGVRRSAHVHFSYFRKF